MLKKRKKYLKKKDSLLNFNNEKLFLDMYSFLSENMGTLLYQSTLNVL